MVSRDVGPGIYTSKESNAMRRDYDIFEKLPDGSTAWRACVSGRFEAERKMQELAEFSSNEFFMLDIQATELFFESTGDNPRPRTKGAAAAG
jgi:hypothetical protein